MLETPKFGESGSEESKSEVLRVIRKSPRILNRKRVNLYDR